MLLQLRKWPAESARQRNLLQVSPGYSPWTGRTEFRGTGISKTPRVLDILDIVTITKMRAADRVCMSSAELKALLKDTYVDVSQSHERNCYTNADGITSCLTTSSDLYSFARDAAILPEEYLRLQGHTPFVSIPSSMSKRDIKALAGEGIFLPCLGIIMRSLFVLKGFDV